MHTNAHEFFEFLNHEIHEKTRKFGTTDYTDYTDYAIASQTSDMVLKSLLSVWYIERKSIKLSSVCSAVVIASRDAKDVMR